MEVLAKLEFMNPGGSFNIAIMRQLGIDIAIVHEPDDAGRYLQTRIRRVQELLHEMPAAVWINQYANKRNWTGPLPRHRSGDV